MQTYEEEKERNSTSSSWSAALTESETVLNKLQELSLQANTLATKRMDDPKALKSESKEELSILEKYKSSLIANKICLQVADLESKKEGSYQELSKQSYSCSTGLPSFIFRPIVDKILRAGNLRSLSLDDCNLSNLHIYEISISLLECSSLLILSLQENPSINDDGALCLLSVLSLNPYLTTPIRVITLEKTSISIHLNRFLQRQVHSNFVIRSQFPVTSLEKFFDVSYQSGASSFLGIWEAFLFSRQTIVQLCIDEKSIAVNLFDQRPTLSLKDAQEREAARLAQREEDNCKENDTAEEKEKAHPKDTEMADN